MTTECSICCTECSNDQLTTLSCSHTFHTHCIDTWDVMGNNTCPMCRAVFESKHRSMDQDAPNFISLGGDEGSLYTTSASLSPYQITPDEMMSGETEDWMINRGGFDIHMLDVMQTFHADVYRLWIIVNRWEESNLVRGIHDDIDLANAKIDLELGMREFWNGWRLYNSYETYSDLGLSDNIEYLVESQMAF